MKDSLFTELNLSSGILRSLNDMGFEQPTPIQEQCIPKVIEGRDLVGQAQTGTGKTAAFGIPIIENTEIADHNIQAIVLCPTRELTIQVTGEIMKLGKYHKGLNIVPVYGGQPISHQLKALKRGAHVVVGTPGRTIDHLNRGTLKLNNLKMLILDEADEMLNMGFREDIETILSFTRGNIQTVMFSATVSKSIRDIMKRYMTNPETVSIDHKVMTAPGIDQFVVEVRDSMRTEAICRFMDINNYRLGLVFCNTKRKTESLAQELQMRGYSSDVLNGDVPQKMRDKVMNKFRQGDIDILVATDVAARGLDVDDVNVVFNYDIPQDSEYYVHRIGRTGRAGREGTAITFAAGRKNRRIRDIEKQIKKRLKILMLPSMEDVHESRMEGQLKSIVEVLEQGGLRPYIEQIETAMEGRFTSVEIAAAFLKMQMENLDKKSNLESDEKKQFSGRDSQMTRLQFNVGKKNKIRPGDIVGAIAGESGIPGDVIGHININKRNSYVDIPSQLAQQVVKAMNKNQIKGKRVHVTQA
ncbi:MAG TPA: DEAD/DEAH box helicase [Balneolales bacterium]|nr:DEAD/DEAH box helicase [Balneolales bacterium]